MHKFINIHYTHTHTYNVCISAKIVNMEKKIGTTELLRKPLKQ